MDPVTIGGDARPQVQVGSDRPGVTIGSARDTVQITDGRPPVSVDPPPPESPGTPIEWTAAGALRVQFEALTSQPATSEFAAYVLQPLGAELLLGLGNAPGNANGAVLVRCGDGTAPVLEQVLDEQGVHDLQVTADGRVFVCGTDPYADWTLGNIYVRSVAGEWTKQRTLPQVIHALGLYHAGSDLFVAAGAHTGDNVTWRGRVLRSRDEGLTWTAADVNGYRIFDVIGFDGRLYATGLDWTGSAYQYELYRSDDAGATWTTLPPAVRYTQRLTVFNGCLYAAGYDRASLVEVQPGGALASRALPFTLQSCWNGLAVGDAGLYVLGDTGVYCTADFSAWTLVAEGAWFALAHWPGTGLLVSERGPAARVLRLTG